MSDKARVLDALRGGWKTSWEVEIATGICRRQAASYLNELTRDGVIRRSARHKYK